MHVAHTIPGWLTRGEGRLLQRLAEDCAAGYVVEIGAYLGRSTAYLASSGRVVHSIDHHQGSAEHDGTNTYPEYALNLTRVGVWHKVIPILARGESIVSRYQDGSIGLLFIDGDHSLEAVQRDWDLYYPKVREGGVIALHDTTGTWPGPWAVAARFFASNLFRRVGWTFSITYGTKCSNPSMSEILLNHVKWRIKYRLHNPVINLCSRLHTAVIQG